MIIDQIKAANIQAMKDRDAVAKGVLSIIMTKFKLQEVEMKAAGKEIGDGEVLAIIQKTLKELADEKAGYAKANLADRVANIEKQEAVLANYLPKQISEDEIRNIINGLEDKSVPSVMKYFKMNYAGQVDMSIVNRVLRSL